MTIPASQELEVWRNSDKDGISFSVTNTDPATGVVTPYDLTGIIILHQVRASPGAPDPALLSLRSDQTTTNGSTISVATPTSGIFDLVYAYADLQALPSGSPIAAPVNLAYDVIFLFPDNVKAVYAEGPWILYEGTTR